MKKSKADICIIGAGPAGLMAAIQAGKSEGSPDIVVLDGKMRAGNKIYATGNGRCNLTNRYLGDDCYYSDSSSSPLSFLQDFGPLQLMAFFEESGVLLHERNGYVYPATDQAASAALTLVHLAEDAGARIMTGTRAISVRKTKDGFLVAADRENTVKVLGKKDGGRPAPKKDQGKSEGAHDRKKRSGPGTEPKRVNTFGSAAERRTQGKERKTGEKPDKDVREEISCKRLILATGGMSPAFGDFGDGYLFAESLGHSVLSPKPALTFLYTDEPGMKVLSGVRCRAEATLIAGGSIKRKESGELQFNDGILSGIPIFQFSRIAAGCLERKEETFVRVNFLPDLSVEPMELLLKRRALVPSGRTAADLFLGLVGSGVSSFLLRRQGIADEKKLYGLRTEDLLPAFRGLFDSSFHVTGTGPFEKAQTSAGGIALDEIDPGTMESRLVPGLYAAGEILDCDGICGGYNLTFAFSTGYRAGKAAGESLSEKA